ncbi:MAG: T9SS type A sorting domain-containing protein [bacterium]
MFIKLFIICTFAVGFRGSCFFDKLDFDNPLYKVVSGLRYNSSRAGFIDEYFIISGASGKIFRSSDPVTDPWVEKNSGTTNNINFLKNNERNDTSITYGVGDNGTIVRSLNQGMTWTVLNSSVSGKLNGIDFTNLNTDNLIAIGDSGLIIKTTNGGANWITLNSGVTKNLNSIYVINFITIIVGDGGTLLRTTNEGTTWENRSFPDTTIDLNKIGLMGSWFFGRILGIAGDNGSLYRSTNYLSWDSIPTGTTTDLYELNFKNASSGFVSGDNGTIRYTTDGGSEWFSDFFLQSLTNERIKSTLIINDTTAIGLAGDEVILIHSNESLLPVELSAFTSSVQKNDVTLHWTTSMELNNSGFEIERSTFRSQSSEDWMKIGFINGNGTTSSPNNYEFSDRGLNSGKYNYRLKQIDFNGNYEYFNLTDEVVIGLPNKFSLSQNYPNPFNPATNIKFDIISDGRHQSANVKLIIFDMTGKEVEVLVKEELTPGNYEVEWNAASYSSGVYFYKLQSGSFVETKKMLLTK